MCTGDYRGHITDDRAKVSIKTSGDFTQLDMILTLAYRLVLITGLILAFGAFMDSKIVCFV